MSLINPSPSLTDPMLLPDHKPTSLAQNPIPYDSTPLSLHPPSLQLSPPPQATPPTPVAAAPSLVAPSPTRRPPRCAPARSPRRVTPSAPSHFPPPAAALWMKLLHNSHCVSPRLLTVSVLSCRYTSVHVHPLSRSVAVVASSLRSDSSMCCVIAASSSLRFIERPSQTYRKTRVGNMRRTRREDDQRTRRNRRRPRVRRSYLPVIARLYIARSTRPTPR